MKIWDYAGSLHDGRTNLIHLYGLGTAPNVLRGRLILHYREEGHVLTILTGWENGLVNGQRHNLLATCRLSRRMTLEAFRQEIGAAFQDPLFDRWAQGREGLREGVLTVLDRLIAYVFQVA